MRIGIPRETAERERRVALIPESVKALVKLGLEVLVQRGAGATADFPDRAYEAAGAVLVDDAQALFGHAELIVKIQKPSVEEAGVMAPGTVLVSLLQPGSSADLLPVLCARRISALSLESVPRITRAQSMDVLSSQATVAGYKAVLIAAGRLGKIFPMLTTAAGTLAPARVFVLGAGVAGLQAIATARRLGSIVAGFDIRPAAKEQVLSLGASFIAADVVSKEAETAGGYAKAQSQDEQQRTLDALAKAIPDFDVVITTAQIPGRPAPRLITEAMVHSMRSGAVIVDLAAETGGNCELTRPGELYDVNGVQIIGPLNVPSTVATHASLMFSKNMVSLLQHLVKDGKVKIDLSDEITKAMCVTHEGELLRK